MEKHILTLLLIVFGTFLLSCNEDEGDNLSPIEKGTFYATISGNIDREIEGEAVFAHSIITTQSDEGSRLQIILTDMENPNEHISLVIMVRDDIQGVAPGTYALNNSSPDEPFVTISYTTGNVVYFAKETGTIELTQRTDESASGSFSAELVEIENSTLKISGQFNGNRVNMD